MANHLFSVTSPPSGLTSNMGTLMLDQATTGLLRYHNFEQDDWAFNLGGSFPEWQAATGFTPSERLAAAAKFGTYGLGCVQGTTTYSRYLVGDVTARPTTYTVRFWVRWKFNSSTSIVEMFHGWLGNLFSLYFSVDRRYAYCRYGSTTVQLDMGESTADTWICFDWVHEVQNNQTRVFRDNAYQGTLTWPVAGAFLGDLNPLGFGLQNNGAAGSYTYFDDLQVYNYDLSGGTTSTPVQAAALTATQFSEVADISTTPIIGNLTLDKSSLCLCAWRRVSSGANTTYGEWEAVADSDTRVTVSWKDDDNDWSAYMTVAAFQAVADEETAGFQLRVKITPAQPDEQIKVQVPSADYTPSATPTTVPTLAIVQDGVGITATISGSDSGTTNTLYGQKVGETTWTSYGSRAEDGDIDVATLADGNYWFIVESFGPNGTAWTAVTPWAQDTDTSATPSGMMSLPLHYLRLTLAQSANFQTWCGALDANDALNYIHPVSLDSASGNFAVVDWFDNFSRTADSGGDRNYFLQEGDLMLYFRAPIEDGDTDAEAAYKFTNQLGAILGDLETLAGTPGYLNLSRIQLSEPITRLTEDESKASKNAAGALIGDYYEAIYRIEYMTA